MYNKNNRWPSTEPWGTPLLDFRPARSDVDRS
jgi:hypothetical protein